MKLSLAMLKNISKQIAEGRAINAIAIANNYLKTDCPIRNALVKSALSQIRVWSIETQQILEGGNVSQQSLLKAIVDNSNKHKSTKLKFCVPKKFKIRSKRDRMKKYRNKRYRINPPCQVVCAAQLNSHRFL